jgi:hypothetical protein
VNTFWRESGFLAGAAMLLAAAAIPAGAQVVNCTTSASAAPIVRAEGNTEPTGDLILTCTGGIPTVAGQVVPQVNFELFLNTNLTSHVTNSGLAGDFSEALLLVDEPNSLFTSPQHPLLNCGNVGAPDNGVSGPAVCSTVSNGNPLQSYDGTGNTFGTAVCDGLGADPPPNSYNCGRPNAFQGRLPASGQSNVMEFLGVPFDPPGAGVRVFRFTNLRADPVLFGGSPTQVLIEIAVSGTVAINIPSPQQTVGFSESGLTASIGSPGVVHLAEGFANSWKARNVAFTLANATYGLGSYTYNGGTSYPPQAAQNVPGTFYSTEDMFQWQNNGLNAPPSPNPPLGFGAGPVANLGNPLASLGFGGVNTGIDSDGSASAGTRFALTFTHTPGHAGVTVPSMVYLHQEGSPAANTGVMVLTSTDAAGAGPFTAGASTTIPDGGTAVYEVLYADPFSIEFADIPCTVNHSGNGTKVAVSFAPFYSTPGAAFATPTAAHPSPTAVPRFIPAAGTMKLQ